MTREKRFEDMENAELKEAILDLYDEAYSVQEIVEMMRGVHYANGKPKVTEYFVKRVITNYGLGLDEKIPAYYSTDKFFMKQWLLACNQVMASGKVK